MDLGAIDEDEFLRRMEIHMDELPDKMADRDHRRIILELLEKRLPPYSRGDWQRAPEILEKLQHRREKLEQRLEKQNPEERADCISGSRSFVRREKKAVER